MKKNIFPILIIFIILLAILFLYIKFSDVNKQKVNIVLETYKTICGEYKKSEIKIGEVSLWADIADNNCKRSLGLSGKRSLNEEGMLFVFERIGNYSFWMKDMNFPIDILWINEEFEIVGIEKNLLPSTFPKSFGEKYLAMYVLEIPALYSEKNNIKVGDTIFFRVY